MIPTLVLVYDKSAILESIKSKVVCNEWMRVVHLDLKVGVALYSSQNTTPFVEGALLFDSSGNKFATRRDSYDDLLTLVEKTYQEMSPQNKEIIKKWYLDSTSSDIYRKVPNLL